MAQDVGRALNPALIEGQMLGGTVQGHGWALYEKLVHDEQGQLLSGSFLDYAIPRASHVPPVETIDRRGPCPRRTVRGQGHRRGVGGGGSGRHRQRHRRRGGHPAARAADAGDLALVGHAERAGRVRRLS